MYSAGRGVPQDYAQAATWFGKAAEQGHADAQFNMGDMDHLGRGVPKDYVEPHKWRNLAAAQALPEKQKEYSDARDALG